MKHIANKAGFSLMELLIVIMLINILLAVGVTVYVGVREKARRAGMTEIAVGSRPELQHWLQSSLSQKPNLREIDTDFNGNIDASDSVNGDLLNNVAVLYTNGRNMIKGERSPWVNTSLWNLNDPPVPGTISLVQTAANRLRLVATGKNGEIITEYILSVN